MAVTLTQLRAFLAVVRTGSVRAAAEELVVTQPSVSAAVAALSRELGAELTERAGRGIRPSAAGEAYAPYAAHVVGLLAEGERAVREAEDERARELRVAAVTTAAEHLLAPLLRGFAAVRPDVRLLVDVGNRDRVFGRLVDHDADVALAGRPPAGAELVSTPFLDNAMVLVAPPDDPLAGRPDVAAADLAGRTWLLREEGSGTRAYNETLLARLDLRPRTLTLGSNGAIKAAVRAGLGVAAVSRLIVALELEAGLLATIDLEGLPARRWYVHRAGVGPVRAPVAEFLAFVQSEAARAALAAAQS